ncbi:hypothetical protein Ae201684_019106 [Aphanomyces euteiches]|uniref:Uncharacterized protein n=1 Tax=Aphanomyces euteiches TaxID=100861 RepID=A0A6G0W3G0_9STRA|nr:hypothetical protein Ae201684_019106 [Aphanomyces euteiches]
MHRIHTRNDTVPFQQFQVLFNSLFKVLFIFPSRYLFAIGLAPIFSFRWNLPPALSCIPKQLDSKKAYRTHRQPEQRREYHPPCCPLPRDLSQTTIRHLRGDFKLELFPLHSPLLRESLLVSFPPLNYMLKFSG